MPLKPKFIFFSTLILCLGFENNLLGQITSAPIIETKKKVFFDVDWKTWFVGRGIGDRPLRMRVRSNKSLSSYAIWYGYLSTL